MESTQLRATWSSLDTNRYRCTTQVYFEVWDQDEVKKTYKIESNITAMTNLISLAAVSNH